MAGPWEAYQAPAPSGAAPPAGDGPWSQYAAQQMPIVQTVAAEENNPDAQRAIASVIANRAALTGKSPSDVVHAPGQFEPWNNPAKMAGIVPGTAAYDQALTNIQPVLTNGPTTDATHFYAPKAQAALGRSAPAWDDGSGQDIGGSRFFARPEDFPHPLSPGAPTSRVQAGLLPQLQNPPPADPGVYNPQNRQPYNDAQAATARSIQGQIDQSGSVPTYKGFPIQASIDGSVPSAPGTYYITPDGNLNQTPVGVDEGLGFAQEAVKPLDNLARLTMQIPGAKGLDESIARLTGLPSATQAIADHEKAITDAAARGIRPGVIGQVAGGVVGTLPTLAIPGGPLVQGAAGGALLTEAKDVQGVAKDAALGGVGGVVGGAIAKGVGKTISGVTDKGLQLLRKEGVPLTLGQMAGGAVQRVEDSVAGFPVVGDLIKAAQRRSYEGLNAAALNRSLAPVGEQLPKGMRPGREAVQYVYDKLGEKYDNLLPSLNVQQDAGYATSMANLKGLAANLPADHAKAFDNILQTSVEHRFSPNGSMSGEAMKDAESDLGKQIRSIRKNPNSSKWDSDLADGLEEAQDQLRQLVLRSNPAKAPELKKINSGYAQYKRIERAAGAAGATEGVFSPANLAQSVRANSTGGQYARGQGLMQDLSDAAKAHLPSTMPDSGTAGRSAVALGAGALAAGHFVPPAAPLLAAGAAAGALYTKSGQRILAPLLMSRTPAMVAAGRRIGQSAPLLGLGGSAALVNAGQ